MRVLQTLPLTTWVRRLGKWDSTRGPWRLKGQRAPVGPGNLGPMAKMHEYPVSVVWTGGRTGSGTAKDETNGVEAPIAVGAEFGGAGGGTNPEEMLAMAVGSCYLITFGIIAENRKIPVKSMNVRAVGEVEENGPQFTYKKITLRSEIVLEAGSDDAQVKAAEDMAHKADNYCIITNAVRDKVEIVVEPSVSVG